MHIDLRSYDPKPEGASPERDENRRGTSWLQARSFTANLAPARTDPRAYSQQPFVHYFAAKVLPHSLDEPQGEIHRPGLVWEHATLRFAPLSVAKSPHPPLSCYVLETLARSKCSIAGRKLSAVVPPFALAGVEKRITWSRTHIGTQSLHKRWLIPLIFLLPGEIRVREQAARIFFPQLLETGIE